MSIYTEAPTFRSIFSKLNPTHSSHSCPGVNYWWWCILIKFPWYLQGRPPISTHIICREWLINEILPTIIINMSDDTEDSESPRFLAQFTKWGIICLKNRILKALYKVVKPSQMIKIVKIKYQSSQSQPRTDLLTFCLLFLINDHFKKSQTSHPKIWPD